MEVKFVARDAEIDLSVFPVVIGSSAQAQIKLNDPQVSEYHCEVDQIGDQLLVRDLGSLRGTFVNGIKVDQSPLLMGDTLTIGTSEFIAIYTETKSEERAMTEWTDEENEEDQAIPFCELLTLLEYQRKQFRRAYSPKQATAARDFPPPPHPEHLEYFLAAEMRRAKVDPAIVYAFEKTGLLVTELNYEEQSDLDMFAWDAAIREYETQYGSDDQDPTIADEH